jgi:hypothetical protein
LLAEDLVLVAVTISSRPATRKFAAMFLVREMLITAADKQVV